MSCASCLGGWIGTHGGRTHGFGLANKVLLHTLFFLAHVIVVLASMHELLLRLYLVHLLGARGVHLAECHLRLCLLLAWVHHVGLLLLAGILHGLKVSILLGDQLR